MIKKQSGFIRLIILLIIVLVVLGYFGINIQNIINSPTVSGNLHYIWNLLVDLWNNVLVGPATFVWNKIIVDMVWNNLVAFISKAKPVTQ